MTSLTRLFSLNALDKEVLGRNVVNGLNLS
jgi:hypothetical protein